MWNMDQWCLLLACFSALCVQGAISTVDKEWMESSLRSHFSSARHHVTGRTYKANAMQFIVNYFQSIGLGTQFDNFTTAVSGVTGNNVIGILKGENYGRASDQIFAIGAHYDTMRETPGVNDNGGSVVAMLQTAKVLLQNKRRQNSILFLAFDFEEWEDGVSNIACANSCCCGSKHFLSNWLSNHLSKSGSSFQGAIILDTVMNFQDSINTQSWPQGFEQLDLYNDIQRNGDRGDFLFIISRLVDSKLTNAFNNTWYNTTQSKYRTEILKLPIPLKATATDEATYSSFFRSDHGPLWLQGYNAIFLTDTGDFRGYMKACYHHPCDNVTVSITPTNMDFLTKTADSLILTFNTLSPIVRDVQGAISTVDKEWMESSLRSHFSSARHHVTGRTYKANAMQFIVNYFQSIGLGTQFDNFTTAVSGVTGNNVIGILKGENYGKASDQIFAIGAHYDTMRDTPGVDDNGGSVVAMLQTAKVLLQNKRRQNSILLLAFDFEEWEYGVSNIACANSCCCGSKHFLSNWLSNHLSKSGSSFQGAIILDTVMNFQDSINTQSLPGGFDQFFPDVYNDIQRNGNRGDFLFIISRLVDSKLTNAFNNTWYNTTQSKFRTEVLKLSIPLKATATDEAIYSSFFRSDHGPLWLQGYNAIFLTDTGDFRGYMKACYHHPCDNVTVSITPTNMDFLTKTANSLILTFNSLSPIISATRVVVWIWIAGWIIGILIFVILFVVVSLILIKSKKFTKEEMITYVKNPIFILCMTGAIVLSLIIAIVVGSTTSSTNNGEAIGYGIHISILMLNICHIIYGFIFQNYCKDKWTLESNGQPSEQGFSRLN